MVSGGTRNALRVFAPGRTELAGNHVDHQGGTVLTAAIDNGITVRARRNADDAIRIESHGYPTFKLAIGDLEPMSDERMTSRAIVRGVAAGFAQRGIGVQGFDATVDSTLPSGGGLSSSAAFELAICEVMNRFFADGRLGPQERAQIAQSAECDYFGKPCGLMDQIAIAFGGISAINLANLRNIEVEPIDFDFEQAGYAVCLVDTGCDHSRFTAEYAKIPQDMFAVADMCGAARMADVDKRVFLKRFEDIRDQLGDRAALRGLHYFRECKLTLERIDALKRSDMEAFLRCTAQSSVSSAQYLQNVSCDVQTQPAMVALALSEMLLDNRGASRIHGGGFGGSIQAFVPLDMLEAYVQGMNAHLGSGSCKHLSIRHQGVESAWMQD